MSFLRLSFLSDCLQEQIRFLMKVAPHSQDLTNYILWKEIKHEKKIERGFYEIICS